MPQPWEQFQPPDMPAAQPWEQFRAQTPDMPSNTAAPDNQTPGFLDRLKEDLQNRWNQAKDIRNQYDTGMLSFPHALFQTTGNVVAGAGNDALLKEPATSLYNSLPKPVQTGAQYLGNEFGNSAIGTAGKLASTFLGMEAQQHPVIANDIASAGNIAKFVPTAQAYGAAAKAGAGVIKNAAQGAAGLADMYADQYSVPGSGPMDRLPVQTEQSIQNPVVQGVNAAGRFSRQPNALDVGINANRAISQQYAADKQVMNGISQNLETAGSKFDLNMPELYDKLDSTINTLKGRVAPGSQEGLALNQLEDIRDNLVGKYGVPQSNGYFTDPDAAVTATRVSPNDLVQIRKSINGGLNTNQFLTAGKGQLVALKNLVNDGLSEAATQSPEFGDYLQQFNQQAAQLGKYETKAMAKLWQPEDYVKHVSGQDLSADGFGRASTILDRLNQKNAGAVDALTSVLPPDQASGIIRAAQINARGKIPSLLGAAGKLATGHPIRAGVEAIIALNPQETNLSVLASNIAKMPPAQARDALNALRAAQLAKTATRIP